MRYLKFAAALAATCASLLMADAAMAKPSDYYAGVGFSSVGGGYALVSVRGGMKIKDEFGAEAELGMSASEKTLSNDSYKDAYGSYTYNVTSKLSPMYAVYGTYTYALNEKSALIGRVGVGGWSLSVTDKSTATGIYASTFPHYTAKASQTGVAAGVSYRYYLGGKRKTGISADVGYIGSAGSYGLGVIQKF
jgi:hypothetical protein